MVGLADASLPGGDMGGKLGIALGNLIIGFLPGCEDVVEGGEEVGDGVVLAGALEQGLEHLVPASEAVGQVEATGEASNAVAAEVNAGKNGGDEVTGDVTEGG